MALFNLPKRQVVSDKDILAKSNTIRNSSSPIFKGGGNIITRIQTISNMVQTKLGKYKDRYDVIRDEPEKLHSYISSCIENGICAIDTETTGLDPMLVDIVGFSIYTPNKKAVYVPINHVSYVTMMKVDNQLSVDFIKQEFQRLADNNVKIVMFNAPFDIRVIWNQVGIRLHCYWDCYIAARLLNENEPSNKLKPLHVKYVEKTEDEAWTYGKLFEGIVFSYVPIKDAYIYAARDAEITFELFKYQEPYLTKGTEKCSSHRLEGPSNVFFNIEMPVMEAFIEMEQTGVLLDLDFTKKMSKKYHELADKSKSEVNKILEDLSDEIDSYRRSHPNCGIEKPINIASNKQFSCLIYDILKIPVVDEKNPRGVGKEILEQIDHPLCKMIIQQRKLEKLLSTYIDKMPEIANPNDGRIHCKFNQVGAATGRTSSDSPNLQNIPSRAWKLIDGTKVDAGHDVRQMFRASPGNILISCDYSAQEPRLTAHLSKDEKMVKAYKEGKDVYSEIAAISFNKTYEECLEFKVDENGKKTDVTNVEGKERRSAAKKIVLGINYGMSMKTIADDLHCEVNKAQQIYDDVLNKFTGLKQFKEDSESFARKYGYVETVWGRKRRLPDMQLPYFEFEYKEGALPEDFDPLSDDLDSDFNAEVPESICNEYTQKLLNASWKQKQKIKNELDKKGIKVFENSKKIGDATRQVVNCVDFDTEILTMSGWKHYNEVCVNDKILSYNMSTECITTDTINAIHIYEGTFDTMRFNHSSFDAVSTLDHRWVCQESNAKAKFDTTNHISSVKWPTPILRMADNNLSENNKILDNQLKVIGWTLTDGYYNGKQAIILYQSESSNRKKAIYNDMIKTLVSLNLQFTIRNRTEFYHEIYINACDFTNWIRSTFKERTLTFDFVSTLSQRQAKIVVNAMLDGDGTFNKGNYRFICSTEEKNDAFQYLCCVAGIATNSKKLLPDGKKHFGNVTNINGYVETKKPYYVISLLNRKRVHLYPKHKTHTKTNGVWCVTTDNESWIARRNGKVFITGNSRVQGSAADLTKLAMIELYNNQELRDLGFKMLIPIHDEILAECPKENAKRCGKLMEQMMIDAARDLIVPISCDAEYTEQWYGEKYKMEE